MFNALFRQAQETVESSLHQVVDRAVLAVLFLSAGGFATAAATLWLVRHYGSEQGLLLVAGGLLVLSLLIALVQKLRSASSRSVSSAEPAREMEREAPPAENAGTFPLSGADKELLLSGLTAIAPTLAPRLIAHALRNLPILVALAALIFVLTRPAAEDQQPDDGASGLAPAE